MKMPTTCCAHLSKQAVFRCAGALAATAKRLGLPTERMIDCVRTHGNTSAASVPLALDVAVRDGRIRRGDTLLLEGFGGGFTWGAVLLKY